MVNVVMMGVVLVIILTVVSFMCDTSNHGNYRLCSAFLSVKFSDILLVTRTTRNGKYKIKTRMVLRELRVSRKSLYAVVLA